MDRTSPEYATLLKVRHRLAQQGVEMMPEEVIHVARKVGEDFQALTGRSFIDAQRAYIPPPPYSGTFDNYDEAVDFCRRAVAWHSQLQLQVVRCSERQFKIQEIT